MQTTTPSRGARTVSLTGLFVLMAAQGLVLLFSLVVVGLGGASASQMAVLLGAVGGGMVLLVFVLAKELSHAWTPGMATWGVMVLVVDVLAYAIALGPLGGATACGAADEALLSSVEAPAGVVLQDDPGDDGGSCWQTFVASIPLTDVLDSYGSALRSDGWTIETNDTTAGMAEGGAPAQSGELVATRGSDGFWINAESGPSTSGGTYVGGSIGANAGD